MRGYRCWPHCAPLEVSIAEQVGVGQQGGTGKLKTSSHNCLAQAGRMILVLAILQQTKGARQGSSLTRGYDTSGVGPEIQYNRRHAVLQACSTLSC